MTENVHVTKTSQIIVTKTLQNHKKCPCDENVTKNYYENVTKCKITEKIYITRGAWHEAHMLVHNAHLQKIIYIICTYCVYTVI